MVKLYACCELPTQFGNFDLEVFRLGDEADTHDEMLLIYKGDLAAAPAPFVRLHSECFTGETLLSLKCDCKAQLETALTRIAQDGEGAIVYLRQEGRGIGLGNKIRAYAEQAKGRDTVEANLHLGFPADLRDYTAATEILLQKGIRRVRLNTNNPDKIAAVKEAGIEVVEVIPAISRVTAHNRQYLQTKLEKMGHKGLSKSVSGN
jgi:GTP cyclohydrolase II